ncbi:hypothetical protein [Escherichia coli]
MENTKAIQYRLRNGLLVDVNADMSLPFDTIERTIMTYLGFNEELNEEHGVAIWSDADSGVRRYITARGKDYSLEELFALAQSFECVALDLFNDPAIAQRLIRELGLSVTPIIFKNGSLTGTWRVERISNYLPYNRQLNGVISGVNQPVACENVNLVVAVLATACRVIGLAKQAFIHFPNGAEGSAEIIACDFEFTSMLREYLDQTVFRAEELDMYITSTIPDDVRAEAIAIARAKCRAAIAERAKEEQSNDTAAEEVK